MIFPNRKIRLQIQGVMPERALLRLRRAGIDVFNVKKIQKNALNLCVKRKDIEKIFAIYPNVCYNIGAYTSYKVIKLPAVGVEKCLQTLKKRWGVCLGVLLFCALTAFADGWVFGVEIVGSQAYAREVYAALDEGGIRPFAKYNPKNQDLICAKLLALQDVEFCSVQKVGLWARVEVRLSEFKQPTITRGEMRSLYTGEIVAITALRGSPLKKVGDKVSQGEVLVDDTFSTEDGGQVRVEIIARVRIACVYEEIILAESEEQAFAIAYLQTVACGGELTQKQVEKLGGELGETKGFVGVNNGMESTAYRVRLGYTVTQTINF